jgi:thiosulfate reductase cytochrome b subunit
MVERTAVLHPDTTVEPRGRFVYRHPLFVRLAHWVNVFCFLVLLLSGLQIFNAHPALYWGEASDFGRPIISIYANWDGQGRPFGAVNLFGARFVTTGVLGWSQYDGRPAQRAFPSWLTLPGYQDLATGRVWHFFFAWLFVINALLYLGLAVATGHFFQRLVPARTQLKAIGRTVADHLALRFHRGEDAARYNVIQQLAYLGVILLLLPLMVLTGLTMSPAVDASAPWLLDLFGGRQSARTIHFVAAFALVLFVFVHVAMVLLSGFLNNMRAMITGWYAIKLIGGPGHEG